MWSLYFVVNQRFTFLFIALRQKIIAKVSQKYRIAIKNYRKTIAKISHCDKKQSQARKERNKKTKERKKRNKRKKQKKKKKKIRRRRRARTHASEEISKKKGFAVMEKPRKR